MTSLQVPPADPLLPPTLADKRALLLRRRQQLRERVYPLSFSQQRLWFLDRLTPGNTAYNIPLTARLRGPVDLGRWIAALQLVVARHDSLRTVFSERDGQPVQIVRSAAETPFELVDGHHLVEDPEALIRLANEQHTRPFDLATGPLMRFSLIELGPEHHILVWTVHHIVADLWSTAVLLGEVVEAYGSLAEGREPQLPPLPIQYPDFAVWERTRLDSGALAEDTAYWAGHLAGAPTSLELPADHPRPPLQTSNGASVPVLVQADTVTRLRRLAQSEGLTPFMLVLACYQTFLHRWAQEDDLVVGVAVANRSQPETQNLIGYFANELALRSDLSGNPTFREYLVKVRATCLGGLAHQSLPFERVVEIVSPERDISRSPLFQASFIYQSIPMPSLQSTGLTLEQLPATSTGARFDIELQLFEGPEITGTLDYNTDLFDAQTATAMATHLEALIEKLVADPDTFIDALPLATETELAGLRADAASTVHDWSDALVLPHLVSAQARLSPDAIAVSDVDGSYTYQQLDEESSHLAASLAAHGVQPGTLVGVCLERGRKLVVTLLSVLKAGAAYLPLDPDFPADRLRYILQASQATLVLAQDLTVDVLSGTSVTVCLLDELSAEHTQVPDCAVQVLPDDLAYVIYTSGSTGEPKGVAVTHAALGNLLLAMAEKPGFSASDRLLAVTTISFDIAALELFLPLVSGGATVIAGRDDVRDPRRLALILAQSRASVLQATPALWRMLFESGWAGDPQLKALVGGEALTSDLAAQLHGSTASLWNMYGPTETTIWSSTAHLDGDGVHLGEPIANTDFVVVDRYGLPVPRGMVGELLVGGIGLARGYLHREDLTQERFIPHPLDADRRAYRTGDLVRRRWQGTLEFLRRVDNQVKLRGYRIELGEIESRLLERAEVGEAVVALKDDQHGDARLVAYVVPAGRTLSVTPRDMVSAWHAVWEDIYRSGPAQPEGHELVEHAEPWRSDDFRGWVSSFTGDPISDDAMGEWADSAAAAIIALEPRRVLEIGCGSGLIMERIAHVCDDYVGLDMSAHAVRSLQLATAGRHGVAIHCLRADQLSNVPRADIGFDTIVLNSVAQYFPTEQYLRQVLADAVSLLTPGGRIFVGDVRSLPLHRAFHTAVAVQQASESVLTDELRRAIDRAVDQDEELVIEPSFFADLRDNDPRFAGVGHVLVVPKQATVHETEMSRYRYDVVLDMGPRPSRSRADVRAWDAGPGELGDLAAVWAGSGEGSLVVSNVGNPRNAVDVVIAGAIDAVHNVGELRRMADDVALGLVTPIGITPRDVAAFAEERGLAMVWDWSDHDDQGTLTAILAERHEELVDLQDVPRRASERTSFTNSSARRVGRLIQPGLRAHLASSLPEYMMPSSFTFMNEMPHTPNGKIDLRALPFGDAEAAPSATVHPANALEERLCAAAADLLDLDVLGPVDNFFTHGGHSLLATRLSAAVRSTEDVDLPVRVIFESPTMRGIAQYIRSVNPSAQPRLHRYDRPEHPPLSYAQQRLWFLQHLGGPSATYNIPMAIRMPVVDEAALDLALADVVSRHEVLRTTFPEVDGIIHQHVLDPAKASARLVITQIDPVRLREAVDQAAQHCFDLTTDIPFRAELLVAGPDDHVLVLTVHHVACDGWSLLPLQRDLTHAYAARVAGLSPTWKPLQVQYIDFALWQRELLGERTDPESVISRQLGYWRSTLDGVPEVLQLPADRPRPKESSGHGDLLEFEFSPDTVTALRSLARDGEATDAMTAVASLAVLLSRLGAGTDLPIGLDVSRRADPALEDAVGFFVNTLVVRAELDQDPSFRALLAAVCSRTLGAIENSDVPFEMLVDALNPSRTMAHHPLIQVLVAWQNFPDMLHSLPADTSVVPTNTATARMDLCFTMSERRQDGVMVALAGNVEYNTDIFDRATIATVLRRWEKVIASLAADPERPVSEVDALEAGEFEQLASITGPHDDADEPMSLMTLLDHTTQRCTDRPALLSGPLRMTYGELHTVSTELALTLAAAGVGPGSVVGIVGHSSIAAIVSSVAVLRSGGLYMPIDADLPQERLRFMLDDASPAALVVPRTVAEAHSWVNRLESVPIVLVDEHGHPCSPAPESAAGLAVPAADDLAYLIYTSGSTGTPKGVLAPHTGVSTLCRHLARLYQAGPGSTVMQFAAFNFDTSVSDIWTAFAGGAALAVPDAPPRELDLAEFVRSHQVTHAHLTPSVLRSLAVSDLAPITHLVSGGEACSSDLVAKWAPGRIFRNSYGPTETSVTITVSGPLTPNGEHPPVGDLIPGTTVHLLDDRLRPVPVGVVGELYIAGECVTRGYLNQSDLTKERFVPDPFLPRSLMYRSGDLFQRTAKDQLQFAGRADDQVKVRGFRIEPGEIEAAIQGWPGVDSSVVVRRRVGEVVQLVAYVVSSGAAVDSIALRAHLSTVLPDYMVPSAIVPLRQLPLTSRGKLDRGALPDPDAGLVPNDVVAAVTDSEKILCRIAAELLGHPDIGTNTSFFDLGGDSILAIQLVSRARAAGVHISTHDVFVHPTLASLAGAAQGSPALPQVDDATGVVRSTPAAEGLRTLAVPVDDVAQSVVVALPAGTDPVKMQAGLRALTCHHAILRSHLSVQSDESWSLVVPPPEQAGVDVPLTSMDASGGSPIELRNLVGEQIDTLTACLDPRAGRMIGATLLTRRAEQLPLLVLVIHHLCVDAVSWRIILDDLATWFDQGDEALDSQPATTSFRAWAQSRHTLARSPVVTAELGRWLDVLQRMQPLTTTALDSRGPVQSLTTALPSATTAALLSTLPQQYGTGAQEVLVATFGIALQHWHRSRGGDGLLGIAVEHHGRHPGSAPGMDLSRTVGWFTSIHPTLVDLHGLDGECITAADGRLDAVLTKVISRLSAEPVAGAGYGLLRHLNPQTSEALAAYGEPQVAFNYLGRNRAAADDQPFRPLGSEAEAIIPGVLAYPLEINAFVRDDETAATLSVSFAWQRGVLEADELHGLSGLWQRVIDSAARAATRPGRAAATPPARMESVWTLSPIPQRDRSLPIPLSFAQLEMFHQPVAPQSPHHNVVTALRLRGRLDWVALQQALDEMLQRHEALRVRFHRTDDRWEQTLAEQSRWPLHLVDVRGLEPGLRDRRIVAAITSHSEEPFDLENGPLVRGTLLRVEEEETVVVLDLHHATIDPWGFGVLVQELNVLYNAIARRQEHQLAGPSTGFLDYAAWQQSRLATGALDESLRYWRTVFHDLPSAPAYHVPQADSGGDSPTGYTQGVVLDAELTTRVHDAARAAGVTPFMFLLAAFQVLIALSSDSDDVAVSYPTAGREEEAIQDSIGYFINVVVVRSLAHPELRFTELLEQVRHGAVEAHRHQEVPLRALFGRQEPDVYNPFAVSFNLVNYQEASLDLSGVHTEPLNLKVGDDDIMPELITAMQPHNLDLYLILHEREGQLAGLWMWQPDRVPPAAAAHLIRSWPALLRHLVEQPTQKLTTSRRVVYPSALPEETP